MSEISTWPESPSLVMVTHHVEEILPCVSHIFMLRGGRVLIQGEKKSVLNSATLSTLYGATVKLSQKAGRYALTVTV
jgi:iron complex transport system ATP-binding protein